MATGFMRLDCRSVLALALAIFAASVAAADVVLVGILGERAVVLSVDGGEPKTVRVGQKWNGVTLVSVEKDRATIEHEGKRRVLFRGQHSSGSGASASGRQSVTLPADTRGHFVTNGAINGGSVRFLVDTGATLIALPSRDALRLGIDYRKGTPGLVQTANGTTTAWAVKFDTVAVGDIRLTNVEGAVIEQGLEIALLGMSFLNRVEMKRDGQMMTLIRRF